METNNRRFRRNLLPNYAEGRETRPLRHHRKVYDKFQFVQCYFDFITHSALLQPSKMYGIMQAEVIQMDENNSKKGTFWVPILVMAAVFAIGALVAVLL